MSERIPEPALTPVTDYTLNGWAHPEAAEQLARRYCEILESGKILFFGEPPFVFADEDRQFLLAQKWSEVRLHKNVSYRPSDDVFRGAAGDSQTVERLHGIMRNYSRQVLAFLAKFLSPYASKWILDFSSFRPLEEQGRDLPLHKRNDLLHVDAFPSRPTRGGRILRVFTNLNPSKSRVWETTGPFEKLAQEYAEDAGLKDFADNNGALSRTVQNWGQKLGIRGMGRTPYDKFMLRFHDYLKENAAFQTDFPKDRLEFAPLTTWLIYTDGVAHAAASGQYAIEQTLIIPPSALVAPELAPYRILEKIAGRSLVS
jgi:hypothetical protein